MCESCERNIRPSCAGLVPGLEFLADWQRGRSYQQMRTLENRVASRSFDHDL